MPAGNGSTITVTDPPELSETVTAIGRRAVPVEAVIVSEATITGLVPSAIVKLMVWVLIFPEPSSAVMVASNGVPLLGMTGVPLISLVLLLKLKPAGRFMRVTVGVAPELSVAETVIAVIAVPVTAFTVVTLLVIAGPVLSATVKTISCVD